MKKVILFDFDGVILQSRSANSIIAKKASLYTWKQLVRHTHKSNSHVKDHTHTVKDAESICANLYKSYGHTLLGLKAIGFENAKLTDYNKYIYDDIDYTDLVKHNNNMDILYGVIDYCHINDISPYIFTNSPRKWVESMLSDHSSIVKDLPDVRSILSIDDTDETFLKPMNLVYDTIEKQFVNERLYFIDDNACNFQSTLKRKRWTHMLYCSVNKKISDNMYFINDLSQAIEIMKRD